MFISVTRLRVRALRFLPGFAVDAVRSRRQVSQASGFRGGALLADRAWTFWTMTSWQSEADMRHYMLTGPHRAAMPRLLEWCDEASVVHWEQTGETLPGWAEADRRMRQMGRPSKVNFPSAQHESLTFRPARTMAGVPIRVAG